MLSFEGNLVQTDTWRCYIFQIEKYQEQGQLLEPHLESMITPIMGIVRTIALEADGGKLETSQMLVCRNSLYRPYSF